MVFQICNFKEFENDQEWEYLNGNELLSQYLKNHNSDFQALIFSTITQEQGATPRNSISIIML
jgi:hypothetical protein